MVIKKQFAPGGDALDDCLDSLVEVLAELLEEPAAGADNQAGEEAIGDLRSLGRRGIHVVVDNQEK